MTNPYEAFNISDDEEDQFVQSKTTDKTRKTHKERRQLKKQGQETAITQNVSVNAEVPAKNKQSRYQNERHRDGNRPVKGVPAGHPLDRRSGTGRQDRPRKDGGGYHNFGTKDELTKTKYEQPETEVPAQTTEEVPVAEQTKPVEPPKPTLAEYYQSKGIDISGVGQKKAPVKGEINAEWLKKEKLTLVETKEDKRKQENVKQNVLLHNNTKVELNLGDSGLLGFGTKPAPKQREQQPQQAENRNFKGKKPSKVVLKEDDFPTL